MTALLHHSTRAAETDLMVNFQRERTTASFEALYRATAPDLLGWIEGFVATRRLGIDPLDALQDTFVNIYRYGPSFKAAAPGGFRAWARTIGANAVRRGRRRSPCAPLLFSDLSDSVETCADRRSSPVELACDAESSRSLRRGYTLFLLHYAAAHASLRPRDQEALRLVDVEGKGYVEVAAHLGVGRSNMKMIVFRARQRLRAALATSLGMQEVDGADSSATEPGATEHEVSQPGAPGSSPSIRCA